MTVKENGNASVVVGAVFAPEDAVNIPSGIDGVGQHRVDTPASTSPADEKLVAMESSMSKLYFCTSRKGVNNG